MPVIESPVVRSVSRRAFTLIEVMCVVVILAIAAAVVFAGLTNTTGLSADSAARAVMADLLYAQNRAIATQQNVYVYFNTGTSASNTVPGQTYAICSSLSPSVTYLTNPVTHTKYTNNWSGPNTASWWPPVWGVGSVTFGGGTVMYFDELGAPNACSNTGTGGTAFTSTGSVVITSGSQSVTISIQPGTGDITVQ